MKRALSSLVLLVVLASGCTSAPDPGDLAAFCSLLESGTGLTATPSPADLDRLVLVAPPAIRPTIEALQSRARDFNELLAEEPPDLEALFNARFDQQATSERRQLDTYAESSCGIAVDRTPSTRWNDFVRANYQDAAWTSLITADFDANDNQIDTASVAFADVPNPISLVEDVCRAVSEFLAADGADPGRVRVFIGSVVQLEYDSPSGLCRLP